MVNNLFLGSLQFCLFHESSSFLQGENSERKPEGNLQQELVAFVVSLFKKGMIMIHSAESGQRAVKRGRECEEFSDPHSYQMSSDSMDSDVDEVAGDAKRLRTANHPMSGPNFLPPSQPYVPVGVPFGNALNGIGSFFDNRTGDTQRRLEVENAAKDARIAELQAQLSNFGAREQELKDNLVTATSENKLLKKAVCIQESKLRDAATLREQMEETLRRAAERISQLEASSEMLRALLLNSGSGAGPGDFHPPPPPPDVY